MVDFKDYTYKMDRTLEVLQETSAPSAPAVPMPACLTASASSTTRRYAHRTGRHHRLT